MRRPRGFRDFLADRLGQHVEDVWGLSLIVTGLLMLLGMLSLTGIFGRFVQMVTGALMGTAKPLLALSLIAIGYVLLRGIEREEPARVMIGATILTFATCGLLHLRTGAPKWDSPLRVLRRAGGIVGALAAEPLHQVVGFWGAALVLTVLAMLGVLIIIKLRVRDAVNRTAEGVRPASHAFGRSMRALFEIEGEHDLRDMSAGRHPTSRRHIDTDDEFYDIPFYDDVLDDNDPLAYSSGSLLEKAPPKRRAKRNYGAPIDGDDGGAGAGGSDGSNDVYVMDLVAAEEAALDAAMGGRQLPEVQTPREPVWSEEQPVAEIVPLPGLAAKKKSPSKKAGDPTAPIVWKLPPKALLKKGKTVEVDKRAVEAAGRVLEEALAAHGVETRLSGMTVGPTVTRFELELAPGVKVAKVTALHKDIAYAMATADVRILAPIPGKSAIGVEVPNKQRQLVAVGDVLHTPEAKALTAPLTVAIGRDIDGCPVLVDLAKMPHVLVAGTTGSGKSSCINSLLTSILMRSTPDEVRMILVDPKMVELSQYNGLPHLLTQVVTNPKKAAAALAWAVDEMERRYELLAGLGFRDIGGYNAAFDKGELEDPYANDPANGIGLPPEPKYARLTTILVVVDELADLMMVSAKDVEDSIVRIAQKARAVGIHLVIATQRPSVNVITGLIKANVPSRFAFAVSTLVDSRVIIDQPGAERLIGQGDMLMTTVSSNIPQRVQGNFVSEEEIRAVVGFWKKQAQDARALHAALPGVDSGTNSGGDEPGVKLATQGFVDYSSDAGRAESTPGFGFEGGIDVMAKPVRPMAADPFAYGGASELMGSGRNPATGEPDDDGDSDDMFDAAMELVVRSQLGSTSMLQRKLRVGFSRAGRIMDLLENKGVVGPSVGSKPREVMMSVEELELLLKNRG
jgi:DNA segregation ATPase FtsK/SpoIIIE, S-DNA-T family